MASSSSVSLEALRQAVVALQADVDVVALAHFVQDLRPAGSHISQERANEFAGLIMASMVTASGLPIAWPTIKPGQRYHPEYRVVLSTSVCCKLAFSSCSLL